MQSHLYRAFFLAFVLAATAALGGCPSRSEINDCNDGIDNDGDGLVDGADRGCGFNNNDAETPDPVACNDGEDNDGDGLIDFGDEFGVNDPGCDSPTDEDEFHIPQPACSDGYDNDGDGLTDYPFDPGCFLPLEEDEEDDCPNGNRCPECANGVDDDGDGMADFDGGDLGCDNAADFDEFNLDPDACGGDIQVQEFSADREAVGTLTPGGESLLHSPACGGDEGPEAVYVLRTREPVTLRITTDHTITTADTIIYFRSACLDPGSEIACNDDANDFVEVSEMIVDVPVPGVYYVIVDSVTGGGIKVSYDLFTITGGSCDSDAPNCAPDQTCRPIDDVSFEEFCLPPRCSDGFDNDFDGRIDYPEEPGCTSRFDATEIDDCPDGMDCPQCGNAVDDDEDGLFDYPDDLIGCSSASDDSEADECVPGLPVVEYPPGGVLDGRTLPSTQAPSYLSPSCDPAPSSTATEVVYGLPVRYDLSSLYISTLGSVGDTVTTVYLGECGNLINELSCQDPTSGGEETIINSPEQGVYYIVVDGDFQNNMSYVLHITGEILPGAACDPDDVVFRCGEGYTCANDVCELSQCNNTIDDDGDGIIDFPDEPGCSELSDNDEDDDCAGAQLNCPSCSNGVDDDGDGVSDYGMDPGCLSAGDDEEIDECIVGLFPTRFPESGSVQGVTPPTGSNFSASCDSSTLSASEDVYYVDVALDLLSLSVSSIGSVGDIVISARYGVCDDTLAEVACAQINAAGEEFTIPSPALGTYFIFADGDGGYNLSYQLEVRGEIAGGDPCVPGSTLFVCESGYACDGQTSTCEVAICDNGLDDDGDGLFDYPDDPGCESPSDLDEADTCPGVDCPACANGVDDDSDGLIDFSGGDVGCESASEGDEIDDCIPGVTPLPLPLGGVSGVAPSTSSNFSPSCHSSTTSSDAVYYYLVDRPLESLTFSTLRSIDDTVLSVRYEDCGNLASEVACTHIPNGGESITLYNPPEGMYYGMIDGDYLTNFSYVLEVWGTLPGGATCDPLDTIFTCGLGYYCEGGTMRCEPTECNNGIDDDLDGFRDYPNDPGCATPGGVDEGSDMCPFGEPCAECGNLMDDDGNGLQDYPADPGCVAGGDDLEYECVGESDPVERVSQPSITGSTIGLSDDFDPSCAFSNGAPDQAFVIEFPGTLSNLTVDTIGSGFDTMLQIRTPDCDSAEWACDDQSGGSNTSRITRNSVAAGRYIIVVDGYSSYSGLFTLNVTGTIAVDELCDPDQVAAGLLSCDGGQTCTDTGGEFRCQ